MSRLTNAPRRFWSALVNAVLTAGLLDEPEATDGWVTPQDWPAIPIGLTAEQVQQATSEPAFGQLQPIWSEESS